jgi:MFS family permease
VPAGRLADRLGPQQVATIGLLGIAGGATLLAALPASLGVGGYVAPIVVVTVSYALFQTANNTAVMRDVSAEQRGTVSGVLNLSRNLGLNTGASVMGAVFAHASKATGVATSAPAAVATGMRVTYAVAAALIVVALAIVAAARTRQAQRRSQASRT